MALPSVCSHPFCRQKPPQHSRSKPARPPRESGSADAPHDSFDFWSGFYDEVNPHSSSYGTAGRGATGGLADATLQTQYLHYHPDLGRLRYATDITKPELLDHDGDVAVSINLSQFRPGTADQKEQASQLRVDATQTSPLMNLFAPLAWTAIASIMPDKGGKIPSLDQLGFKSDQATSSTSHILLTKGTGKLAVNISRAPNDSGFLKVLKVMMTGLKIARRWSHLPAISVPALNAFSEAFAYWEDRTRFIMNGNLVNAIATQQAMSDPEHDSRYIGLVSGDYVMVPQKHTDELASQIAESRSDARLPGAQRCRQESSRCQARRSRHPGRHVCHHARRSQRVELAIRQRQVRLVGRRQRKRRWRRIKREGREKARRWKGLRIGKRLRFKRSFEAWLLIFSIRATPWPS